MLKDQEVTYATSDGRYHTVMPTDPPTIPSHPAYISLDHPDVRLTPAAAHLGYSMRSAAELESTNPGSYMVNDVHGEERVYKYSTEPSSHITLSSYGASAQSYHPSQSHQAEHLQDDSQDQHRGYPDTDSHLYGAVRQNSSGAAEEEAQQRTSHHYDLVDNRYQPREGESKSMGVVLAAHTNSSPSSPAMKQSELLTSRATADVSS